MIQKDSSFPGRFISLPQTYETFCKLIMNASLSFLYKKIKIQPFLSDRIIGTDYEFLYVLLYNYFINENVHLV